MGMRANIEIARWLSQARLGDSLAQVIYVCIPNARSGRMGLVSGVTIAVIPDRVGRRRSGSVCGARIEASNPADSFG